LSGKLVSRFRRTEWDDPTHAVVRASEKWGTEARDPIPTPCAVDWRRSNPTIRM